MVVVVKDGQVLTERGYGYADVAKKTKVDPKTTLSGPGSVSKLFTWTAVMQQVEQGKVDLNADVNKYIDFKIPPYEGKPVTVLNLMTHTPGFEEQVKDLITLGRRTGPVRHAAEALGPEAHLRAGHDAGLFQLWREPRRLHRRSAPPASRSTPISSTTSSGRSGWRIRPSASRFRPTSSR